MRKILISMIADNYLLIFPMIYKKYLGNRKSLKFYRFFKHLKIKHFFTLYEILLVLFLVKLQSLINFQMMGLVVILIKMFLPFSSRVMERLLH